MSLAEIKLDRQRKRNEAAETSLTAAMSAHPLEKRQVSRGKGKWKPFDYASDTGGVPVETRVNTYSRASSQSRPISALSHRTDFSTTSDGSGFQVFTGRKGRRNPAEQRSCGTDKPQTTVEATFDEREVYEVFGNALPGPEYLVQTLGQKDGQLQFLQHPNGDISAQQWSAPRFMWINIGMFSNIRKKVEGQLASDRLKGEMAHHTLQQNTLQYFRTIAKQREALALGLPFGPKEIEAALPTPSAAHPSTLETDQTPSVQTAPVSTSDQTSVQMPEPSNFDKTKSTAPTSRSSLPLNAPREPAAERWEVSGTGASYSYDPFYQTSTTPAASTSAYGTRTNYPAVGHSNYAYGGMAHSPYRMGSGYHYPQVPIPNQTVQSPGAQKYFADRAAAADKVQSSLQQVYGNRPSMGSYGQPYYAHHYYQGDPTPLHAFRPYEAVKDHEIVAPQPKSMSSVDRSAMRDTLKKLGETAKERNLSQTNIRTVLHDPFQSSSDVEVTDSKNDPAAPSEIDSPLQPRAAASRKAAAKSPPMTHAREQRKSILQESSPDTQWSRRPYERSTPFLSQLSASSGTSKALVLAEDSEGHAGGDEKTSYESHLNDWWMNGSIFARQEDLYKAIVAAQAADSNLNSPPAHLTPIGPPSSKNSAIPATFNEITTRLLIPVVENLASYVEGPVEKRRDYWCPWGPAPEWCIDRSPEGNKSFFDSQWGSPPQRIGRDLRYSSSSDAGGTPSSGKGSKWQGVDPRFACAGRS